MKRTMNNVQNTINLFELKIVGTFLPELLILVYQAGRPHMPELMFTVIAVRTSYRTCI
jgi:hypothetical protein